jgi:hypothetical protein
MKTKGVDEDILKLWRVSISTKGDTKKLKVLQIYASNISHTEIDIKDQLGGESYYYLKKVFLIKIPKINKSVS